MLGTLNVTTKIVAYGDPVASSNPRLKYVDWLRNLSGVSVANPKSQSYSVAPGTSKVVFDGTLASTIDGTTAFGIALSTVDSSRYRLTHTAGTAPGFRTGRGLTMSGIEVTFTVNSNATVSLVASSGTPFASVVVGDEVFVPHTTTGDSANVISVLNAGYWQVLGKASSTQLTLVRPSGQDFEGISQTVTLTANSQIRAYSAAGLQIGDSIDITGGFHTGTRKTFTVLYVTDLFVEFVSTVPLATETGVIPTASGMQFFNQRKTFVYIEANQECVVRVNGDNTNQQRLSPPDPSDTNSVAAYMRQGPTWSLTIVNLSTSTVNVTIIDCE